MTRKQRLEAVLKGEEVDRPPVSFYDLNGCDQNEDNPDEYNVYSHPSWKHVLKMAREETDHIFLRPMVFKNPYKDIRTLAECKTVTESNGNCHRYYTLNQGIKTFNWHDLRERDVDTVWNVEHPLKTSDDLESWLDIFEIDESKPIPDITGILHTEDELGESGIVCIDYASPLCEVAEYFSMQDFLVIAMEEQALIHKALELVFHRKIKEVEAFAEAVPGRLWRIYGPEFACSPFLPPKLFKEYAMKYDAPIVDIIRQRGGYPRIHCHGNLKGVLHFIRETGWAAIDPVEPPPQGDVTLREVREALGNDIIIFGNIELNYIETLDEKEFISCVRKALKEGPINGRNFVLMTTASPIGRVISPKVTNNYRIMIDECVNFRKPG